MEKAPIFSSGPFHVRFPAPYLKRRGKREMPLPHFLLLILFVIVLAGLTIWAFAASGVPMAMLGLMVLVAAGVARMMARVE